jgi:polyvinyl alcohol dehydrogenase (cytochrome)
MRLILRFRELLAKVGVPTWGGLALLLLAPGGATAQDGDWPMYNHDVRGSRFNGAETILGASNVGSAQVLWNFQIPDASVSGTPAVVGGAVYAGDSAGRVWAVKASDGTLLWKTELPGASFSASALVTGNLVVIGSLNGAKLYGLNRVTGAVKWTTVLDPHPLAAIFGSATKVRNYLAVGVASNEETATLNPAYPCCTTRGSLALVDPKNGAIVWQTYTTAAPHPLDPEGGAGAKFGPSGASIWSTPTFDDGLNLIYATTGNNFSEPTSATSDAIIAFDATSGAIVWSNQRTADDLWNFRYPFSTEHPDFDIGDSAQIYTLSSGRKVVGAGQKSGFYHVLDAATGEEVIAPEQYVAGGVLGGLFADSAVANGVIYANAVDWNPFDPTSVPRGHLFAFSADTGIEQWHFETPFSPNLSGVAVANGVVYFQSLFDNNLYALDATSGAQLIAFPVGRSTSGPAVSNGRVYMGTGDVFFGPALGGQPALPGGIVAIGLP